MILLIEGDPGIGKTRLCEDFLLEPGLVAERAVILRAHPRRPATAGASELFHQLLGPLASLPGVGGAGRQALAEVAAVVPEFRERFPELPPGAGGPAALGEALAEVLSAVADERPVVLFVDDLGALDTAARESVTVALARPGAKLLAIIAARSEDVDGAPAGAELPVVAAGASAHADRAGPRPGRGNAGSMLALRAGDRQALASRLHAEGGGNPSYTVEMVSALVDDGSLAANPDGSWHLAAMDEHHLPLPRSLREAVGRRLTLLDVATQQVVDAAAVVGRVFRRDLLLSVSELDASAAEAALGELLTRRLIRRVPGAADTYEFAHELVARVAYERVPPARRHALHRAAARAWKRQHGQPDAAAAVANHLARARAIGQARRPRTWQKLGITALAAAIVVLVVGVWALGPERRATLTTLVTRPQAKLVANQSSSPRSRTGPAIRPSRRWATWRPTGSPEA